MSKNISKILYIKIGRVNNKKLKNGKREELVSAIKKEVVKKAYLLESGFKGDSVADKVHHGGVNKAVFILPMKTFKKINANFGNIFKIDDPAFFGENLILDNVDESSICIGDILNIGKAQIQITQPRQPCWKLSASTGIESMTKFIFENGLTGFYAKVLKEGDIQQNNEVFLESRENPNLTIEKLNKIILNPLTDEELTIKALSCEDLGHQFKNSLEKRYKLGEKDDQFSFYHT